MAISPTGAPPDGHETRILQHFGPLGRAGMQLAATRRFLLLGFTNRSGSNFLAELLASTGACNLAEECFIWDSVAAIAPPLGMRTFEEYASKVVHWTAGPPWFAVKCAAGQFEMLARAGFFAAMAQAPVFLTIERRDRLAQAISLAIARHTGQWTSAMPPSEAPAPRYCRAEIDQCQAATAGAAEAMARFFAHNGIRPLRIEYEQLLLAPQAEIDRVAELLQSGPLRIHPERVAIARQRGALNEAWRQRYLAGD